MIKKNIALLPVALFGLCSCGIYTSYKPATEVPDQLYGEEVAVADTTANLADWGWEQLFADSCLRQLIERGLRQNTDLLSASLRVEEAEATLLSAKLAYLPSFALAPQGVASSFDKAKAVQTYSLPVTAAWEIDLFGKLRNAKRQSSALLQQSRDYQQAVRTQVIASIANIYYTLLMLDAQLEVSEQTATSWQETVESMRALMEAGMANEAAVSQMEAVWHSVRAAVLDLKDQINTVENSLSLLLAETPHQIERGTLAAQHFAHQPAVGVPLQLLSRRPDVRMAEDALASAFYVTNSARAAFYPSITLSGSVGWTNSAGGMVVNPAKVLATAIASLTQPLFAQGKLTAQLKIAKARQEEASLAFRQTLLNAGVEVNEAVVQYQTACEKTELIDRQTEALARALESTRLLMQHGNTTYLEVLTAQQSLLSARLSQIANRTTQIQSIISLYQALGGC